MSDFTPPSDLKQRVGWFGALLQQVRLVWRLLRDHRVSGLTKAIPLAGLAYVLSPIDLIPGLMLPGLGQLDDVAILFVSLKAFIDLCPPAIVREHLAALAGRSTTQASAEPFIDAPYHFVDQDSQPQSDRQN